MQLQQILESKGTEVHTVDASATVAVAVASMTGFRIGALVIVDGDRPVGMISEREVLSRVVALGRSPGEVLVSQAMTGGPVTAPAEASLEEALELMRAQRCRHLLVVRDGRLCGVISMGDITWALVREREAQIEDLVQYITHG